VAAHEHDLPFGLSKLCLGGPVDISAAQRAANPQLRGAGAHEISQAALGTCRGVGLATALPRGFWYIRSDGLDVTLDVQARCASSTAGTAGVSTCRAASFSHALILPEGG
jgi:hypothetical protein